MPTRSPRSDSRLAPVRTPRFRSETEEAVWWDANLDRILKEGISRLQSKQVLKPVTLRLLEADIALARTIAAQRGMQYQTYLKTVLHSALQAEAKRVLKLSKRDSAPRSRLTETNPAALHDAVAPRLL